MRDYERAILLERVERDGATVGAAIPAELEVDGEVLPLRERVLEITADEPDDEARERARRLVKGLRGVRRELRATVEDPATSREEGEQLVETIAGIDRAINALTQLDAPGVAEQAERRQREDRRRWMNFLKEALGQDEGDRRA